MSEAAIVIRQMSPGDIGYVFATCLRAWREVDLTPIPNDLWYSAARALLERLLASRSITALVLCASDQPTQLLGYIIAEEGKVLWQMYVRKGYRQEFPELEQMLVEAAKLTTTSVSAWLDPSKRWKCQSRKCRSVK